MIGDYFEQILHRAKRCIDRRLVWFCDLSFCLKDRFKKGSLESRDTVIRHVNSFDGSRYSARNALNC
jgi:hypothetical protein